MYNDIHDIKNNTYFNRDKNKIDNYIQKAGAGKIENKINIGNGVEIAFNDSYLKKLEQELEDTKKLPGSYPMNQPYKISLTNRPKWYNWDDNENYRLYKIREDKITQIIDEINEYETTKEIVKNSLENYRLLMKYRVELEDFYYNINL
jgi:hypothetical protein